MSSSTTAAAYFPAALSLRTGDDDARLVEGIAVPWDETVSISGVRERFQRGALDRAELVGAQLYVNHGHQRGELPIGRVVATENQPGGQWIRATISRTPAGDVAHTLLRDQVLRGFSIGFTPLETRDDADGTVAVVRAAVSEVSVAAWPAYSRAAVQQVRHREGDTQMPATDPPQQPSAPPPAPPQQPEDLATAAPVVALRQAYDELDRRVAVLAADRATGAAGSTSAPPMGAAFRSYGEYIKAAASTSHPLHSAAVELYRAWTGGVSGDAVIRPSWVGDLLDIVNRPRRVWNAFSSGPLPDEGMQLEYTRINTDTLTVARQTSEGATLPYGKVSVTTASAPVETYGGWTSMSRQEVERANVNIVGTAFEALAARYAQATEAAVRAVVAGAAASTVTVGGALASSYDAWIDFLVEAADHLDGKGKTLDGILLGKDAFKAAAKLKSGERYLIDRDQGTINVPGLSGDVMGVPFLVAGDAAAAPVAFNRNAVRTWEAPGAPARLQDADITNLTNQFSVYGYAAIGVLDPGALVTVAPAA